jgi:hypothetical protein
MQKWGKNPLFKFGLWPNNPKKNLKKIIILKNWRIFSQKFRKSIKILHLKKNSTNFPFFFKNQNIKKNDPPKQM